jgi:predicted ATPase
VPASSPNNIPIPITSFVGRQRELKHIAGLLAEHRLVTLTGPGGVGKTRLAIETALASLKKFADGVFWVDLVGVAEENLIPQEIAHALQLREVSTQKQSLH